eukprot:s1917_g19.t1
MGLVSAVMAILSLCCGGLCHLGTVCTSFNYMNSGTHTRSIAFPMGWRPHLTYVQLGNILASRSAVLAFLAWAVGGVPTLEQPLRSVMVALPSWQSVIAYFDEAEERGWKGQSMKLNQVFMACFKAATLKPTALYSTESFDPLMNMRVPPPDGRPEADAAVTYQYTDAHGKKKVQGGPGLKKIQLYTAEFGRALAGWWRARGPISAGTGFHCVWNWCFMRFHFDSQVTCGHMSIGETEVQKQCVFCIRRERRRWCLVQSADLSADAIKDSPFQIFRFVANMSHWS